MSDPNIIAPDLVAAGWRRMVECPTSGSPEVMLKLPDGGEHRGCFSLPSGGWRIWVADMPRQEPPTERCGVVNEGAEYTMQVFKPLPAGVYPVAWKPL